MSPTEEVTHPRKRCFPGGVSVTHVTSSPTCRNRYELVARAFRDREYYYELQNEFTHVRTTSLSELNPFEVVISFPEG